MSEDGTAPVPEGLRTDQAPPLAIPASFFVLAPIAMVISGLLVAAQGANAVANRLLPAVLAGTHLATLGFLGSLMLGALYQMIPVVAGAPVPFVRVAHGVHAAWVGGVAALVLGLATGAPAIFRVAQGLLGAALLAFLVPVSVALARTPAKSDTVTGMRLAVLGLLVLGALGLGLAEARASGRLLGGGDWVSWITAHAALGGLVWIGGILTSVSWQVVPMFYLTQPLPAWSRRATLAAVALALVGVPAALATGASPRSVALAALPAALAIWGVHPLVTARALQRRRRRRADTSARFWLAGLACAPVALFLALATAIGEDPRWSVALGWVVLWGWAGLIAHGMSCRIVPFLVFFHRYSRLVGLAPVPSMKELLPEARQRVAFLLHATAVATGAAGIAGGVPVVARTGGLLLAAAGAVMGVNLIRTLSRRPAS
jgi:hypothetical protein